MCILRMKIMKDFPEYQNGLICFVHGLDKRTIVEILI